MVKNCPVVSIDVTNANTLLGPDLAMLKGKTVITTSLSSMTDYIQIPKEIVGLNHNVTWAISIMFVNGLPFLVSILRNVKFVTVEYLLGRNQPSLIKSIRKIIYLYNKRGFNVNTALMDPEFECLRADLPDLNLNTTAESGHVLDIERQIHILKERTRASRSTCPFKAIPGRIIIELVYYTVFWLNSFPPLIGLSDSYTPTTTMTGTSLYFRSIVNFLLAHIQRCMKNILRPRLWLIRLVA
jgi:hypothetical protein